MIWLLFLIFISCQAMEMVQRPDEGYFACIANDALKEILLRCVDNEMSPRVFESRLKKDVTDEEIKQTFMISPSLLSLYLINKRFKSFVSEFIFEKITEKNCEGVFIPFHRYLNELPACVSDNAKKYYDEYHRINILHSKILLIIEAKYFIRKDIPLN